MKKKFRQEIRNLKTELKKIAKSELRNQIDAVVDDVLEELSIETAAKEQDDPSVGEKVKEAFLDFANALSPLDFKELERLQDVPNCDELSLGKNDLEFEEPEDGLVNVAIGKTASQSSQYKSAYHDDLKANLAIDGNLSGEFEDMSLSHTDNDDNPWWQVELESSETIRKIIIHSRTDCCQERLRDFRVILFQGLSEVWSFQMKGTPTHITTIPVNGVTANKVYVDLDGRKDYLSLAEVEVIADAK